MDLYQRSENNMHQDFILKQWNVWPPQDTSEAQLKLIERELLSDVPPMLKRRLTPLAKIVFCAANQCADNKSQIPIVFSSTHGELAKSFSMMELIEAKEEISPTSFSLSVHNAIAGLFSIAYQNQQQMTVVAPGEEGIAAAFLDALGLLNEGTEDVLLVFYDEPLVEFYPAAPFRLTAEQPCALAIRISKTGMGTGIHFSCGPAKGGDGEQPIQLLSLIAFLAGSKRNLQMQTPRHSWCWTKT